MKTNNGYDINENQCIDIVARQFILKTKYNGLWSQGEKKIRNCL